jgi:hypothetical protein
VLFVFLRKSSCAELILLINTRVLLQAGDVRVAQNTADRRKMVASKTGKAGGTALMPSSKLNTELNSDHFLPVWLKSQPSAKLIAVAFRVNVDDAPLHWLDSESEIFAISMLGFKFPMAVASPRRRKGKID